MPTCVLYSDEDMEAITVIEVPMWAMSRMRTGDRIRFVVPEPALFASIDEWMAKLKPLEIVSVWAERFVRRGQEHVVLFTRDELNALKLDSTELSGQRAMAQERYRRAFAEGFGAALLSMYR